MRTCSATEPIANTVGGDAEPIRSKSKSGNRFQPSEPRTVCELGGPESLLCGKADQVAPTDMVGDYFRFNLVGVIQLSDVLHPT